MKNLLCIIAWGLMSSLGRSEDRISIDIIDVKKSESHFFIQFSLENKTDNVLYYISPFTSEGRQVLAVYFVGKKGGETLCIQHYEQSTGLLKKAELKPHEKKVFEIDLMDGRWAVVNSMGNGKAKKFYLELNIPQEDGYRDKVWSGNAKSKLKMSPVELREIYPSISRP